MIEQKYYVKMPHASRNAPKEIRMKELEKESESQFNREFQSDFHERIAELGAKE